MRSVTGWMVLLAFASGCSSYKPSPEEVAARNQEFFDYCEDLQDDIDDEDNVLRKATMQDRYNQECLGQTYPQAGDN